MKPMAFNLKDAKKVGGDDKSSTFQLKSGHQIKILHAPLSALHRQRIEKMPVHKFAYGGDDDQNSSQMPAQPDEVQQIQQEAASTPPDQQQQSPS